ncbi:hypothetical protein MHBO_002757 [Bonamia ostreae]|uniref:Uncharacterized protein n=1 Tax=Bonamia ostreae TaxID=126728 RepID=A0ABV2ANE0_9EUKA
MLHLYSAGVQTDESVDFDRIAIDCVLSSGADIANIVNTAKISAAKNDRTVLSAKDFEAAVLDVSNGVERQSLQLGAPARRALAISESACALVSLLTKSSSRELRRISIVPRGLELSSSRSVPSSEDAMVSQSVEQLLARIDADIAGQIGQELLLGKSRIMSDSKTRCERATKLARSMSAELGMGKRLGFAASMFANENVDWRTPYLPAQTRSAIDEDAVERLKEAEERVLRLLRRNKSRLLALSEELLVRESLGRKEIERVVEEVPEDDFEVKTTNKID